MTVSNQLAAAPFKSLGNKPPAVEQTVVGSNIILSCPYSPANVPLTVPDMLVARATAFPERVFLRQREPAHGAWRELRYADFLDRARAIASHLLDLDLSPSRGLMILSENTIEHACVAMGAMFAGAPVVPVSPAYSLHPEGLTKLRHAFSLTQPGLVFAQEGTRFSDAFGALLSLDPKLKLLCAADPKNGAIDLKDFCGQPRASETAFPAIHSHTVAKVMFTSGSTGLPKAVPQTHRMMMGNIAAIEGVRDDRLDLDDAPQGLDWMPWSHIAAGNYTFNDAIWQAGTINLDDGRPTPDRFAATLDNLKELMPASYFSAPIAYPLLLDALERDGDLRSRFFARLQRMRYGGAPLSTDIYHRLQRLAVAETGYRIPIVSMFGATETQAISGTYWATEELGLIGLPLPGANLKLVPVGPKFEVRVKAPTVTLGYLNDPEQTEAAFDDEGFYRLGDAVRFVDPGEPNKGLAFDGRIKEDFKLSTGTWVSAGVLRLDILAACAPLIQEVLIAGEGRSYLSAMIWLDPAYAAASRRADAYATLSELLMKFNARANGSSRRVARYIILDEPPSAEAGELSDKGSVNQRLGLQRRMDLVDDLYRDPPGPSVVSL